MELKCARDKVYLLYKDAGYHRARLSLLYYYTVYAFHTSYSRLYPFARSATNISSSEKRYMTQRVYAIVTALTRPTHWVSRVPILIHTSCSEVDKKFLLPSGYEDANGYDDANFLHAVLKTDKFVSIKSLNFSEMVRRILCGMAYRIFARVNFYALLNLCHITRARRLSTIRLPC